MAMGWKEGAGSNFGIVFVLKLLEDNEETVVHIADACVRSDRFLSARDSGPGERLGNSDTNCNCGPRPDDNPGREAKSVTSIGVGAWYTRRARPLVQLSAECSHQNEEGQLHQGYYRLATRTGA